MGTLMCLLTKTNYIHTHAYMPNTSLVYSKFGHHYNKTAFAKISYVYSKYFVSQFKDTKGKSSNKTPVCNILYNLNLGCDKGNSKG